MKFGFDRSTIILIVFALLTYFFWNRFLIVGSNSESGTAYKLNRLTGEIQLLAGKKFISMEEYREPKGLGLDLSTMPDQPDKK